MVSCNYYDCNIKRENIMREKLCSDSDPWIHIAPLIQSKNADWQAFCLPIRVSV